MKVPVGAPRPPGWVSGPQAAILGVLLRPGVRVFRPGGAFVGQFGTRTAPNGPKRGPRALGWTPLGSGGRVLGRNPLRQHGGCLVPVFCLRSSRRRCVVSFGPRTGPRRPRIVRKRPTVRFLLPTKRTQDHLGCSETHFRAVPGPFCTVLGHRLAPKGSEMGRVGTEKGSKNGRKQVFLPSEMTPDHLGCSNTPSEPVWLRLLVAVSRPHLAPNPLEMPHRGGSQGG